MKILETINNVALAFLALPESIREARAILAEQRDEADDLSRVRKPTELGTRQKLRLEELAEHAFVAEKRVAELESELTMLRDERTVERNEESSRNEISHLIKAYNVNFRKVGEWRAWCLKVLTRRGKIVEMFADCDDMRNSLIGYVNEIEADVSALREKVEVLRADVSIGTVLG